MLKYEKIIFYDAFSHSNAGWVTLEEAIEILNEKFIVELTLWILEETDKYILGACAKSNEDEFGDCKFADLWFIPKGWIKSRKKITAG